ncbi:hypothetical protein NC652_020969 [Populus alba x Populus x berolinensis]|nr:hypothetical protein NC652_020969 [Populus alba x Populus x berolinensis]
MDGQLQHHQITVSRINEIVRDKNVAAECLSKCLYSVGTLYDYGARKVTILFGIPPIGAAGTNGSSSSSSCVDRVNNAVQLFNTGLRSLVDGLNNNLTGANFTETSNIITATGSFNSQSPFDAYPMDIRRDHLYVISRRRHTWSRDGPLRQQKHFQDESFEGFKERIHASSRIFR